MVQKRNTPDMFSEIAGSYDLLNHLLSLNVDRLWRRKLIHAVDLPRQGYVLDACTGTADVAIGIAKKLSGARVVGVDRSAGMLAIGREKVGRLELAGRIELLESDVLALPFDDGTFDAVTIAFGLRNLPDYAGGIGEMARVLRPGGKLAVLEFCPPSNGLCLRGYNFYLQRILPLVGGIVSGSGRAYRYLAESIDNFLTADTIEPLFRTAGLMNFCPIKLAGGIAYIYVGARSGDAK